MKPIIPLAFLITYTVVGCVALNRWSRSVWRHHPQGFRDNPEGWLRHQLSLLIVTEVFALAGAIVTFALAVALSPHLWRSDEPYLVTGAVLAVVLFGAVCLVYDLALVKRIRRMARGQQ